MAGARPTLTGVTSSASRGGLFDESNIASPVSGADVQGTVVNDSEITLSITIDGNTETGSFRTNAATDMTVPFTFTNIGGGSSTGTAMGTVFDGGFDPATGILTLNRTDGFSDIVITGFTFTPRTNEEIETIANTQIGAADIQNLNNVPNPTPGTTDNQLLAWDGTSSNITYVPLPTANVDQASFSSSGSTVEIGPGVGGAAVNLEARPEWEGNTGRTPTGATPVTGDVEVARMILHEDTGLVLTETSTGVYTIRAAMAAPVAAPTPEATTPPPSSALDENPPIVSTITLEGGSTLSNVDANGMTVAPVAATVTDPTGTQVPGVVVAGTDGGTTATVTIPMGGADAPGNYNIDVTTYVESSTGLVTEETDMVVANRPIPFFHSRTEPTTETMLRAGTIGMNAQNEIIAWPGSFTVSAPGSGLIYLSVLNTIVPQSTAFADQANFPVRVSFVREITVTLADMSTRSYNVFRMPGGTGQLISNFRIAR